MITTRRGTFGLVGGGLAAATMLGSPFAAAQGASASASGDANGGAEPTCAIVAKIGGIPWFNAMEAGIRQGAAAYKVDASMIGPAQADAAQQVQAVQDLIARRVQVIGIVPNDAPALEPVLGRALQAGIKVISHEGTNVKNTDWDLELTTIDAYGRAHMDLLAREMGGRGAYIVYVGSLTVPLHNAWADAAIAYQKRKYPDMRMLGDRFGVAESVDDSFKTTLDQIRAHPDLAGILTFGSQGPIGAARALDDRGKAATIALVGGFSPGQGQRYVRENIIRGGYIWNPKVAGTILVQLAGMLAAGRQPTDGMQLFDVGTVRVDPDRKLIQAQKLESLDKNNIGRLVALGL